MAGNNYQTTHLSFVGRIVWLIVSIVILFLTLRFIFILFGANSSNGFVSFIYDISYPLARPFFGIFGYNVHYGVSRVEIASLIAIGIYTLVGYILVRLLTFSRS